VFSLHRVLPLPPLATKTAVIAFDVRVDRLMGAASAGVRGTVSRWR